MQNDLRFAFLGTNDVAGTVNLQAAFWIRVRAARAALRDVKNSTEFVEIACVALNDAAISLGILLGQNQAPKPKSEVERWRVLAREKLPAELYSGVQALFVLANAVRH